MATRMSPSQLRSKLRQIENKQKQAIKEYNNTVKKHNQNVRRAVTQINNAIRHHNNQVKQARAKIASEIRRLNSQPTRITTEYTISVHELHSSYERVAVRHDSLQDPSPFENALYSGIEQENASNLETAYMIENDAQGEAVPTITEDSGLTVELSKISLDLESRWKGALFSLHPRNPDATRHFCTSAREIFSEIFKIKAPDALVLRDIPNCERTPEQGTPTRRAKIKYLLRKKGSGNHTEAENFVDADIKNILELIQYLSGGTHGPAGKFSFSQLQTVQKRVEGGLKFLCGIVA